MDYRLLALDVDGTLLDSDHRLRPRVAQALRAVASAGFAITLATGKQFRSIRPLLDELGVLGPQICLNGAAIVAGEREQPVAYAPLLEDDRREVIAQVRRAAPDVLISQFALDAIYVDESQRRHPLLGVFAEYGEQAPMLVSDLPRASLPPTAKILVAGSPQRMAELRAVVTPALHQRVYITTTMPEFLEFFAFDANKGTALRRLRDDLGIPREGVIAVGDGENDIPLLREAGLGVAMGNARPATLAMANHVIPSNDDDGLAVFLEALLANPSWPLVCNG
ncbi:MAG TPA: Cof-type HAD-IIB family hydrolase, partial [Ktedonobacterales bacterium]